MKGSAYYTLLASLPPLPRFDRALRLPISGERLKQRFRMLNSDDARLMERAMAFFGWQKDAKSLTEREMVKRFQRMAELVTNPSLKALFDFPLNQRTVMVALRRRHSGFDPPRDNAPWGVGRYVRHIERNWEAPHFKLAAVYPWLKEARNYLEEEDVLNLDRLLKNTLWNHLDRSVPSFDFGFRAVMSYRMKWDMVDQWLSHDVQKAGERFNALVKEIVNGQPKLFH